jgi:hypothetical protein
VQVTPGKVGQTSRHHAVTKGPKELDFTKVLVKGRVRHCFCCFLHGRSRLEILFGETGADIELQRKKRESKKEERLDKIVSSTTIIMGRTKGSHTVDYAPSAQKSDAISPCVVGAP